MAVHEIFEGVGADLSYEKFAYTRAWIVTGHTNPYSASQAPGVDIGQSHPNDSYALATRCDVEALGNSQWRVTITYETGREDFDFTAVPWVQPAVGTSNTTIEEVFLPCDLNNKAFIASNGKLLDPAPAVYLPIHTRTVTKNYTGIQSLSWATFAGCVNSATWNGFAARRVLCAGISSQQRDYKGIVYEEITFEYRIKPNVGVPALMSWQPYLLDQGDCEWDGTKWVYIGDDESDANTTTRLLNGAGRFLSQSDATSGNWHYTPNSATNGHKVYQELPFTGLPWA